MQSTAASSKATKVIAPIVPKFVDHLQCTVLNKVTGVQKVYLSKTIEIRFVLRNEFGKSGQDQTRSGLQIWETPEGGFSVTNLGNLDKIRHDQGFPNS